MTHADDTVVRWRPTPDAVPDGPPVPIMPPAPGSAVLACRCGRVLSLPEMHRPVATGRRTSGPTIEPIRCRHCATA